MSKFQSQIIVNTSAHTLSETEMKLVTDYANSIVENLRQPDTIFEVRITENRLKIKDTRTGQRIYSESLSSVISTAQENLVVEHYLHLLALRTIYIGRTGQLKELGTTHLREFLDTQSPLPADDKELITQVELAQDSLSRKGFGDYTYKLYVKVCRNQTKQWATASVTHLICATEDISVYSGPITDALLDTARATIAELRARLSSATQQWEDATESDILNRIANQEVSLVSLVEALTWLNLSH